MTTHPDRDGEYTDSETPDGSAAQHSDEAQAEGEYTDSDTPEEKTAATEPAAD
ncbi:hypothetical protein [Cryobacterium sp. AP23]